MAIALSTAGIKIKYAVETTAGTRPTTGFTAIAGVKNISSLNPEPSQIDVTTLDVEQGGYKQYIPGLKDPGGSVTLTANLTDTFRTAWSALVTAADTAANSDKSTWFEIVIPGSTDSFFFAGRPTPLGLSSIDVDSALEIEAYIMPNAVEGWATKTT